MSATNFSVKLTDETNKIEDLSTKAKLFAVAEKLFAEKGLASTSIRDLAREAESAREQ